METNSPKCTNLEKSKVMQLHIDFVLCLCRHQAKFEKKCWRKLRKNKIKVCQFVFILTRSSLFIIFTHSQSSLDLITEVSMLFKKKQQTNRTKKAFQLLMRRITVITFQELITLNGIKFL